MKERLFSLGVAVASCCLVPTLHGAASAAVVGNLRCEYHECLATPVKNPVPVVDAALGKPRLSWVLQPANDTQRGLRQTAYQVVSAGSLADLQKGTAYAWDSGKVASDQSVNVEFGGTVAPAADCYWKVRVWDQNNNPSAWSEPARWVGANQWQAKWIGLDHVEETAGGEAAKLSGMLAFKGCSWVWTPGSQSGNQPLGSAYFRKTVDLPAGRKISQAGMLVTGDDSCVIYVNGQEAGNSADWKQPATLDLAARLQPGKNVIAIKVTNGGNSPSPAGLVGKLVVLFDRGEPMVSAIDPSWKGNAKSVEGWNGTAFDDAAWGQVSVIGKFGEGPWGDLKTGSGAATMPPAPQFRKALNLAKPVKRAVVFASALGMYDLRVNGQAVANDVFGPGWTDYHKRVHYFAYDVTSQVKPGANVIGATLGEGWYASYLAFSGKRHYYGGNPRLMLQLEVNYQDGTKEIFGTDDTWKAAFGPLRQADMLMGCIYDARLEMKGWDAPGFDDAKWQQPMVDGEVAANLEAHPGEPIRRIQELPARSIKEPKPGVYIFDLGQNMVGWARISLQGDAGQKVVVRHAEMLNPDGTIYVTNLRAAKATDTYYLSGGAKRAYEPSFTFHGFQYVEITGLTQKPELSDVTGIVVHSDLPIASAFECSEPLVNKLVLNGVWGQRGNFLDVPTDCPQRDERAGWTGDAQVFMKTACLNLDAPGFFTKWLVDLCDDSQNDQGGFGDVAPHINVVGFGNTGWADSGIVCNYRMYEMYGDTRVLARHYPALEFYMAYLARTSKEFVRGTGAYGDWLRLAGPQHSDAIGTAYYYYSAQLMVRVATALGKAQDAEQYRQLSANIKEAYVKNFIREDGRIMDRKGETGQSFYALAFGLDLVPAEMHAKVAEQFVETIRKQDWHLATGFLGTPFVLFALEKAGHAELAYQLVLNKTYPSWLQQVIWGSSTMWERWDGWRPDKGFQDPGMNSFNHYWLGCVSEWLYTRAAGIDTDGPGFKQVVIKPLLDPSGKGLSQVKASYRTIRGPVSSQWEVANNQFGLRVSIPGNVTAVVHVPAKSAEAVKEGGKAAAKAPGVKFLRMENGAALFEVGAGQYHFESPR